jgi:hypothetical protein
LVWPGKDLLENFAGLGCCSNIPIAKRLIILSKGFWLDPNSTPKGNEGLQVSPSTAFTTRGLSFVAGSSGSVLSGFDMQGQEVVISTDRISIRRNYNCVINLANVHCDSLVVEGNYRVFFGGADNPAIIYSNMMVRNNFIGNLRLPLKTFDGVIENNTWAYDQTSPNSNGGGTSLSNSVVGCCTNIDILLRAGTWIFQNNLIISYKSANQASNENRFNIQMGQNTVFNNNVNIQANNNAPWPVTGSGNITLNITDVANIFEAFPAIGSSTADGRYRLKAKSPAKAGSTARPTATVDAGMYGGPTPYKLGMIPSIPTIYKITSPNGNTPTGSSIEVQISTRSNN